MRDERLLAWQQQRAAAATVASPTRSDTQRRRSLQSSPQRLAEDKPTTTAPYTQQYLRKRRSQQKLDDTKLPSPKTNGNLRRHSSEEDAVNGNGPSLILENGHQAVAAPPPTTVERTRLVEEEVASSGKGLAVESGGQSGAINQAENEVVKMTKKRGRSTVVLAVAAGVVSLSVAGGVAVCRLYPSSPAAISIRLVASRTEEILYARLVELGTMVEPCVKDLAEAMRAKMFALLKSERLIKAARAGAALASEQFHVFSGLVNVSAMILALMEDARGLAVSCLIDVLKLVVGWIMPHLKAALELMQLDSGVGSELVDRVWLFLLTALVFLAEVLKQGATWATSSVDEVFQWTGFESDVNDAELPSDEFLVPLLTQQTAIQSIGRGLTARESRALDDVKHSEKRRVAIASATNSIISDTREILDSILDVKMIALELVEERIERLADQYAASIEQELEEYKHTTQQVQAERGPEVVIEVVPESQPQVVAAESLKQELALRRKTTGEKPSEADDNEEQGASGAKRPHEEQLPVDVIEAPVAEEQDTSQDVLLDMDNHMEEAQSAREVAEEKLPGAELTELVAIELSFSEEIFANKFVSGEQIEVTAELNGVDSQIDERSEAPVVENPLDDEHATEDQTQIVAEVAKEKLQKIDLATSDKEAVVHGELEQTVVTEVLVELDDIVLEVEHTQVEVANLYETDNVSAADILEREGMHHQEEQTVAHPTVPVDGTEMEFVVELDKIAADTMEKARTEQIQPDVSTRIAILSGTEVLEEDHKSNMPKSAQDNTHPRVDKESLVNDGTVEVYEKHQDSETVRKVEVVVVEAEAVVAELERIETELTSLDSYDDNVAESETQAVSAQHQEAVNLEAAEGFRLVTSNEVDTLETERVVAEKEIDELVQLEQVLLQEDERVRAEEELRVIAEEEEIELQKEVHSAVSKASSRIVVHEDRTAGTIHASTTEEVDVESGGWRSSLGFPLPRSALVESVLLSTAFLSLALLAVYLLTRYRKKRELYARAVRQRKRWQRLADMDDSDIEEVVLQADDSSDDEADAKAEERSLEVAEPKSGVNIETSASQSSGGVEAEVDQKISEDHEDVDDDTDEFHEEEDVVQSDSESAKSRTVVIERLQSLTYTVNHPTTPKSNASADDSDTASPSVSTPPYIFTQDTPDTSERARRRLRREMRT